jgi:hypothetical protein
MKKFALGVAALLLALTVTTRASAQQPFPTDFPDTGGPPASGQAIPFARGVPVPTKILKVGGTFIPTGDPKGTKVGVLTIQLPGLPDIVDPKGISPPQTTPGPVLQLDPSFKVFVSFGAPNLPNVRKRPSSNAELLNAIKSTTVLPDRTPSVDAVIVLKDVPPKFGVSTVVTEITFTYNNPPLENPKFVPTAPANGR